MAGRKLPAGPTPPSAASPHAFSRGNRAAGGSYLTIVKLMDRGRERCAERFVAVMTSVKRPGFSLRELEIRPPNETRFRPV
jgi:hypothetical protein